MQPDWHYQRQDKDLRQLNFLKKIISISAFSIREFPGEQVTCPASRVACLLLLLLRDHSFGGLAGNPALLIQMYWSCVHKYLAIQCIFTTWMPIVRGIPIKRHLIRDGGRVGITPPDATRPGCHNASNAKLFYSHNLPMKNRSLQGSPCYFWALQR